MVSKIFFFVPLLSILACDTQNAFTGETYTDAFQYARDFQEFNGNILVAEEGEIVFLKSAGLASTDTTNNLSRNTAFRLASVSKHFTALGVLTLVDSGKVRLDEDVRTYIPELPYTGITVRHLLNHTSGIPDYEALLSNNWMPNLGEDDPARFITGNEDIIEVLVSIKPEVSFAPGEQWEYSNTGYVLLATIITRVSGMQFDDYLESYIFSRAGLSSTLVFDPINISPIQDRAYGFRSTESGNVLNDLHFINPAQGDGGIYSTLDDLFIWDQYLYDQEIVSPKYLQAAYSSGTLNNGEETGYGFGWGINKNPQGEKVLGHSGGWVGFSTYFYRDISSRNTIIVLTNNSSGTVRDLVENLKTVMYEAEK